jgi:signal transduction histidine kinase
MEVVIVSPRPTDWDFTLGSFREQGIAASAIDDVSRLSSNALAELGCVMLVEEALEDAEVDGFHAALESQPPWSDLPLLLIAAHESPLFTVAQNLFPHSGNVTLLQRPIHPVSLVSAVRVALRARARQLEVRDLLDERGRAVRKRDEFLAMLAHELRNPLAPIRSAAYMLDKARDDPVTAERCRAMIDRQAKHLTRLVDDLLDASRLELGKVRLRPQNIDANLVVQSAVDSCASMTNELRHTVSVRLGPEPLWLAADPVRLEQVFCNLVVNAAKFTPKGGLIEVEAHADGESVAIAVSDNGIGIDASMLDSIFELFTQDAVSPARSEGGLGIGLTVVRRLVELHGGTVRAFSDGAGSGARFEVRLPVARIVDADLAVQFLKPAEPGKPRALLQ